MNPTRVRFEVQDALRGKASGLFLVRAVEILDAARDDKQALRDAVLHIAKMTDVFLDEETRAALEVLALKI
ncbi:MAG: hypothetical protein ABIK83_14100 [Candidatus Zixiibacteriota bacterium]